MLNTSRARFVRRIVLLSVWAVGSSGCTVAKYLHQGDTALAQHQIDAAVTAYDKVLDLEPDNQAAHDGIKRAHRAAVKAKLADARGHLRNDEFAEALEAAMQARAMPLDLDDVTLSRAIDDAISKAASGAEQQVQDLTSKGKFAAAVTLSQRVVAASPGVSSRKAWADQVRQQAVAHYTSLAKDLAAHGLDGSAALQWAVAKAVGAKVDTATVESLWNQFTAPVCFAVPTIAVAGKKVGARAKDLVPTIEAAARSELNALRARCGEGDRPLGITITLSKVDVVDSTTSQRHAKSLPGFHVKTEEVYYEKVPYKTTEEVTVQQERHKTVEHRDCAPRPGQKRGCRTWTEDVVVKVPVKKVKEVTKYRKVKKTRPVKGPLPADEVLTYNVKTVTRRLTCSGTVQVAGTKEARPFDVMAESVDTTHPEITSPKLTIPADPLQVKSLAAVVGGAASQISAQVKTAVADAVKGWTRSYAEKAHQKVLAGQMPQAEELYLHLLALGVGDEPQLRAFFQDRYGKPVRDVMAMLGRALGAAVAQTGQTDATHGARGFPKRHPSKTSSVGASVADENVQIHTQRLDAPPKGTATAAAKPKSHARSGMSAAEMQALEAASLDESSAKSKGSASGSATGAKSAGAGSEPAAASGTTPAKAVPSTRGAAAKAASPSKASSKSEKKSDQKSKTPAEATKKAPKKAPPTSPRRPIMPH